MDDQRTDTVTLASTGRHLDVEVEIDVARGGRMAQIAVSGVPLLIDPPAPAERDPTSVAWGSYPMAPWVGRIRNGQFSFFGTDHQLQRNQDDSGNGESGRQHAMHGTVLSTPWSIDERTPTSLSITCPLARTGSGWTLGGTADQRFELLDGQLRCDLSVSVDSHSPDNTPFPAEIGWHPWWRKPNSLTFHPDAMYQRDDVGLPTGHLVRPSTGPWDDCFVNTAPITLHYDRPTAPQITVSSDCDHWVVYDLPAHATCVEPQSGPPDAFNLRAQIVTATHPLRRTMIVSW